jgi:hypothetical protein
MSGRCRERQHRRCSGRARREGTWRACECSCHKEPGFTPVPRWFGQRRSDPRRKKEDEVKLDLLVAIATGSDPDYQGFRKKAVQTAEHFLKR